ncbi:MAG: 2-dehydropantoate 2-reductase [Candidatus Omnitrophota bacterium]
MMKVVIVGPGAMGCLLGSFLAKLYGASGGPDDKLWLLEKSGERAARLIQSGIEIDGVCGSWRSRIKVTASPAEIGRADLVIICVKAYHTRDAVTQARVLVDESTRVLTMQNGIGNIEIISELVGQDKVIGGITSHGATLLGHGRIRHAGKGETVIGRLDGKIPVELRQIRELFNKAGIQTRISRDIKGLLWSKLIVNVGINALSAVTRLNNGRLLEFETTRRVMREAVTEAIRIAKRKRIKLIYDDPLAKVETVCEATGENISSMLQDILNKKRTEIDFINGVIVRQAQELGVAVPVNSVLVDLVKTLEQNQERFLSQS